MIHSEFDVIILSLGDICNFQCKYCSQERRTSTGIKNKKLSRKLINFFDKYNSRRKTTVIFLGGEPLLYFDLIKEFVNIFKNKFSYRITSNGSLLDQNIVDFINENNIGFSLSHDGEETEGLRNFDVLKNPKIKNLFLKIKNKRINVCLTSLHKNAEMIFDYFSKIELSDVWIKINPISNFSGSNACTELADLSEEQYLNYYKYLLDCYEKYLKGNIYYWRQAENVSWRIKNYKKYLDKNKDWCWCSVCDCGGKMLNLDIEGNVLLCHNTNEQVGTVNDLYTKVYNAFISKKEESNIICQSCEARNFCSQKCILIRSQKGIEQFCRNKKAFMKALLSWENKTKLSI